MSRIGDVSTQKMAIQQIAGQMGFRSVKPKYDKEKDATYGEIDFPGGHLMLVADEFGTTWIISQDGRQVARGQNRYGGSIQALTTPIVKWMADLRVKGESMMGRAECASLLEEVIGHRFDVNA